MKKTQRAPVYKTDEFEDLTLFANESFDTQDVDLFEFSSEESSPLTRLKSVILSLDWEINDDILQELADELENLQSMWQGDKVAEVYLQGLNKIGVYIRSKGAYAHPNSIKLLLTFFYDFEKIISSHDITGETITQLLKADVRKFKILQYQINQNEVESTSVSNEEMVETALAGRYETVHEEADPAKELKAAILSLDWEVTDESLKQFNIKLSQFYPKVADNKPALVLTQGLEALGDYIADERAEAHPEAFILLHSFNEALEQLTKADEQHLDQEKIQDILVDRINRLNNLKMLIAAPSVHPADAQLVEEVVEEISTPVTTNLVSEESARIKEDEAIPPAFASMEAAIETPTVDLPTNTLEAELDTLFATSAGPAMETSDIQYPDEILSPDAIHPVADELADDLIEANLSSKRGLMPALSDTDELSGFNEDAEPLDLPIQSDLAEQLDFLFADTSEDTVTPAEASPPSVKPSLMPALSDTDELSGFKEDAQPLDLPTQGDLAEQLDFLFADTSEDTFKSSETPSTIDTPDLDMTSADTTPSMAALADKEFEENEVTAALAGIEQPAAEFSLGGEEPEGDQNVLELQNKLDSFFDAVQEERSESTAATDFIIEEIERSSFVAEENDVESALADSEEKQGFSEEEAIATLDYTPMDEIEEKLDFFFGSDADNELGLLTEVDNGPAAAKFAEEVKEGFSAPTEAVEESRNLVLEDTGVELAESAALTTVTAYESMETNEEFPVAEEDVLDNELEGALDFFFDASEDDETEPEMIPTSVDELTQALEATMDGDQKITAHTDQDEQPVTLEPGESKEIQLATLGALLPGIVRDVSRDKVAKASQLMAAMEKTELSSEQLTLVQLLDSAINLLLRLPAKDNTATEKLINYLYEHLLEEQCLPEVLSEAIGRYTNWMQQAITVMPLIPAAPGPDEEPQFTYTAKELYVELSELRGNIREEFAKLRRELHHKT